jgi:RNA binding exosome subunit
LTNISENILLSYAFEKGEFSFTSLLNDFVGAGKCAKETLLKYKKLLERDGKLSKKLSPTTGRPVYYVPETIRKKMEAKHIFNKIVDSAKPEEMANLVATLQREVERFRFREDFFSELGTVKNRIIILQTHINKGMPKHYSLEGFLEAMNEDTDEFKRFLETLDEPLDKGWITIDASEEYRFTYEVFKSVFADFKKKIGEGKIKFVNT